MSTQTILCLVLVIPVILLLWYVIGSWCSGRAIIKTKKSAPGGEGGEAADLPYFLPTAALQVKATAKVIVRRKADDKTVLGTWLGTLELENTVIIQPDTGERLLACYAPSIFSNDDVKVSATAQGLLENVAVTAEARIANIIGMFTELPAKLLSREAAAPGVVEQEEEALPPASTDETLEFTNTFVILASELREPSYTKKWMIHIDGMDADKAYVDASMRFDIPQVPARQVAADKEYTGLLVRPLRNVTLSVTTKAKGSSEFANEPLVKYDIQVPDHSSFLCVPVKRAPFVKNQYAPKFNAGMLVENTISKPSELEGFAAIPVNILKAIFSIPAQLFNFKINHLKEQTDLETAEQKLKALKDAAKPKPEKPAPAAPQAPAPAPDAGKLADQLQSLLQEKLKTDNAKDSVPGNLGKLPAEDPPPGHGHNREEREVQFNAAVAGLPAPPPIAMWQGKVPQNGWLSYGNEITPLCVPAAGAHLITSWTANAQAQLKTPPQGAVDEAYKKSRETAGGCKIWKFLDQWLSPGLFGEAIDDYIKITTNDVDKVKLGVHYFGGCLAGLQLPRFAHDRQLWERPQGPLTGDAAPGSWCGHAVAIVGYYPNYFIAVSLGQLITMSWDFYLAYNDESYVVLNKTDWMRPAEGTSPADVAFNDLANNIGSLQG